MSLTHRTRAKPGLLPSSALQQPSNPSIHPKGSGAAASWEHLVLLLCFSSRPEAFVPLHCQQAGCRAAAANLAFQLVSSGAGLACGRVTACSCRGANRSALSWAIDPQQGLRSSIVVLNSHGCCFGEVGNTVLLFFPFCNGAGIRNSRSQAPFLYKMEAEELFLLSPALTFCLCVRQPWAVSASISLSLKACHLPRSAFPGTTPRKTY